MKDIRLLGAEDAGHWDDGGLKAFGLPGFNETRVKPGAHEILAVAGRPLLVVGQFGQGRTVAFTGFTPSYSAQHAEWDAKIIYPYLVDQELYRRPLTGAYLHLFAELLTAASGEKPQISFQTFLTARETPLFETLKSLPQADVKVSAAIGTEPGEGPYLALQFTNHEHYARLLRVRVEWDKATQSAPYLTLYDENYFDLQPRETRTIKAKLFSANGTVGQVPGKLIVTGTNVEPISISITYPATKGTDAHDREATPHN